MKNKSVIRVFYRLFFKIIETDKFDAGRYKMVTKVLKQKYI